MWTYDFMEDATSDGRMLRLLTVVDEFTRESRAVDVARRMPAWMVIAVQDGQASVHGTPA